MSRTILNTIMRII